MKEIIFTPNHEIPKIKLNEVDTYGVRYHAVVTHPSTPSNRRVFLLMRDRMQPYDEYFWHDLSNHYMAETRYFYREIEDAISARQKYLEENKILSQFYEFIDQEEFVEWAKRMI